MGWRRNRWPVIAIAVSCALIASACGRSAGSSGSSTAGNVSPTKGLVATTPAGTKTVSSVVWAVYRDVNSLDPIYAFDYPENTADSLMCESLLRQAPDGSLQPGLATVASPSPTTIVFTLRPGVKFWDSNPVTSADVVYSLERNTNPSLGGFYPLVFNRVASITATSQTQVTIKLKQPDYWLEGELSSMPGIVIEKSFAEKQGKNYGTPAGSIMCTGQLLDDYDALICPTFTVPALAAEYDPGQPVEVNGQVSTDWLDVLMTIPFNIASRCPVISVPSGRSRDGVPTGLSVVGKTYDDITVFRIAAVHEERMPWLDVPERRPGL